MIRKFLIATALLPVMSTHAAHATVMFVDEKGAVKTHEAVDYLSEERHSVGLAEFLSQPVKWPARRAQYEALIIDAAMEYGLPDSLIHAVIMTESAYDAYAESQAGAVGLMQLMPATAQSLGVDNRYDPEQNVRGGCKLLQQLLTKYRGDLPLALAAYNAGEGAVTKYGGIPPYAETEVYIERVQHLLSQPYLTSHQENT